MSLIVFQHETFETSARLGEALRNDGHRLRTVMLCEGEAVPTDLDDVDGVISMGGTMNVDEADKHDWIEPECAFIKQAHETGLPIVGICLGHQLIAKALGGEVGAMDKPEIGFEDVRLAFPGTIDTLMSGIPWNSQQFHFHGQEVKKLPDDATPLAGSKACKVQAFKVGQSTYAFQYHFEWDIDDIRKFVDMPWVNQSGYDKDAILKSCDEHYPMYRQLGDRLCENIATYLFRVDRR